MEIANALKDSSEINQVHVSSSVAAHMTHLIDVLHAAILLVSIQEMELV